jgi:preprotein translocase subunit SecD
MTRRVIRGSVGPICAVLAVLALSAAFAGCGDDEGDTRTGTATTGGVDADAIAFYDWEPNVIGPDGRPEPRNRVVTQTALPNRAAADKLAARVPGAIVVEDEEPTSGVKAKGGWFVLTGKPALTGADIARVEMSAVQGSAAPAVTISLTPEGRERFKAVSREIAQRGAGNARPGAPPTEAFGHFAVVVDGRIVTRPFIDFQQNPDGFDAANGLQIQGQTVEETEDLVHRLQR